MLVCREVGKPIVEARGEVARTAAILRYHAQAALDPDGETYPPGDGRSLLMSRRRPRGVVGLITPWNFPLAIPAWKLAPALAYGNACVWKASPLAPASAEALMACLEPELPAGLVQLVQGGVDAGVALAGHAGLGAISFTGSAAAGASVARQAADRGLPAQCEMGGQNASIVLADADLGRAAAIIARAAMGYAGQKCTATSRVIAERRVAADLRDALVAEVRRPGRREPGRRGLRGRAAHHRRRPRRRGRGGRAGGWRRAGGCSPAERRSTAPATTSPRRWSRSPDAGAELAQEEVFAPVAAVLEARDAAHAVELTNGVRYGLSTSIFTRDLDRVLDLAGRLDTGLVRVNQPTSGVDLHAPFGGEKASGLGPREQGKAARELYTSLRTILVSPAVVE